ncbi:uncharacterized protein LOC126582751 [Malus sylvestris]|uniref:uncharacterized protein LOC126582751 n=1 Tax=Malus sylvestris TaxID=3752 RepID=UPI0021ABFE02|nr:uncharacterized protein LOC126582751 [Malus sylvestris]
MPPASCLLPPPPPSSPLLKATPCRCRGFPLSTFDRDSLTPLGAVKNEMILHIGCHPFDVESSNLDFTKIWDSSDFCLTPGVKRRQIFGRIRRRSARRAVLGESASHTMLGRPGCSAEATKEVYSNQTTGPGCTYLTFLRKVGFFAYIMKREIREERDAC